MLLLYTTRIHLKIIFILLSTILSQYHYVNGRDDLVYNTSFLDGSQFRRFYRTFRDLAMFIVGQTGQRTRGPFLQETAEQQFPCNVTGMRSETVPTSVHRLRPGDIDVIAALGDSLTTASGAASIRMQDLFIENRGLSWSIGGQWDWRNASTLPNILKVYNPKLMGFSKRDSFGHHLDSQLNMAEIGASSADMQFMAKSLVQRIKSDRRINFKKSWKMVSIAIGGNDICSFVCTMEDPESLPRIHKQRLVLTLRYLRDKMPRTFVNIVPVPFVKSVVMAKEKPTQCTILHHGECACWVGRLYNQSKKGRERYHRIQQEMHRAEEAVAAMKEFRRDDFAVVYQPWTEELSFATEGRPFDLSLLAFDCFHMSQKGHGWAGVALWNNLLEPPNNKTLNWTSPSKRFKCPTDEHPYFFTNDNYGNDPIESTVNSIDET